MAALVRYGRQTSFHTLLAKVAAVLQAAFLLLLFFLPQPLIILFYVTAAVTALDLVEETILVALLPHWQANVKGLYSIRRRKRTPPDPSHNQD
jgi:cardiolipin synthase